MRFALKDNERILSSPLIKDAICPLCKKDVIAKCGNIKVWHWAHKNNKDCDSWSDGETEWHLNWKSNFPKECQEVIIEKNIPLCPICYKEMKLKNNIHGDCYICENYFEDGGIYKINDTIKDSILKIHRADVKINDVVIEFQNSSISDKEIEERELFYNKMKWVLNGETLGKNISIYDRGDYYIFRWKYFPKSWAISKRPLYVDFSHELFFIKKINSKGVGWGKLISKQNFIRECENGHYSN